jgi:TfoX C-terminal domain
MKAATTPFTSAAVQAVFDSYPPALRKKLLALRQLILDTAASTEGVGEIDETLKWGEPAYVTLNKKGSTVRIDRKKGLDRYAIYFNCNTTLVDTFRSMFPHSFAFEGNRAMVFGVTEPLPKKELAFCIGMALTYHQRTHGNPGSTIAKPASPRTQAAMAGRNEGAAGLLGFRNIGPTVAKRLASIGITNIAALAQLGAPAAYRRMAEQAAPQRLPVCYYLYSLEGALQDRHWDDFTANEKMLLRQKTGLAL